MRLTKLGFALLLLAGLALLARFSPTHLAAQSQLSPAQSAQLP
jgi:hypothetical protein